MATERPRRVAVWRDTFAPYSETFIHDELRHHVRWEATVFAHERLNEDKFPWDRVVALSGATPLGKLEQLLYRATTLSPTLALRARQGRYDLVHAHFGTAGVRSLPYVAALGLPLITMFHGGDLSRLVGRASAQPKNWLMKALAPVLFARSDLVLAASTDLRDNLVAAGCDESKVEIFRLGIDLGEFKRQRVSDGDVHVVMVGRLVEKKGFDDGLRAVAAVLKSNPNVRVTVAGGGPLESKLRAQAQGLGIGDAVAFTGALTHKEVKELLADADVVMAPSAVTPSGDRDSGIIVVKEAAASMVPTVGTIHGGLPEIIADGETGYLVPEHDVDGLTDRLGRIVGDPKLRDQLGAAARAKIEREYDIRKRVADLELIYDRIAENRRAN